MSRYMSLKRFLFMVRDGDGQEDWSYELTWLIENHGEKVANLARDIKVNGQREPVKIGPDGRCWDGHHRIAALLILGKQNVMIEHVKEGSK